MELEDDEGVILRVGLDGDVVEGVVLARARRIRVRRPAGQAAVLLDLDREALRLDLAVLEGVDAGGDPVAGDEVRVGAEGGHVPADRQPRGVGILLLRVQELRDLRREARLAGVDGDDEVEPALQDRHALAVGLVARAVPAQRLARELYVLERPRARRDELLAERLELCTAQPRQDVEQRPACAAASWRQGAGAGLRTSLKRFSMVHSTSPLRQWMT